MSRSPKVRIRSRPASLDPWNVLALEFPATESVEEQLWFLLHYAVLAPSTHNSQPWLFRIRDHRLELWADWGRSLPVVDPDGRELVMSCGAALQHLRLALHYFGRGGELELYPDPLHPYLLARIGLGPRVETEAAEVLLFQAIPRRRTNRQPYLPDPLPEELLESLAEAARREGAWLECVTDDPRRQALGDLVAAADRVQWADRPFRQELAAWLRPNDSRSPDGIPGWAEGLGDLASQAGPMVIRTFDLGRGQAAKDREIALGSPVLAVLGTDRDTPLDWLAAGQALARVLLRARSEEVWASFLNQPVEVEALRAEVARVVGREGAPQALLRLGRATEVPPTRRRPVREVFEDSPNLHREATHDVDL